VDFLADVLVLLSRMWWPMPVLYVCSQAANTVWMRSFLFWGLMQCWLVVRYRCCGMAYWSQNNGNQLSSMVCNILEERRPQRQCCFPLACLFGWYSQMWQGFFFFTIVSAKWLVCPAFTFPHL